eukprot:1186260-Prorocentrum_minimum.AAC.5
MERMLSSRSDESMVRAEPSSSSSASSLASSRGPPARWKGHATENRPEQRSVLACNLYSPVRRTNPISSPYVAVLSSNLSIAGLEEYAGLPGDLGNAGARSPDGDLTSAGRGAKIQNPVSAIAQLLNLSKDRLPSDKCIQSVNRWCETRT